MRFARDVAVVLVATVLADIILDQLRKRGVV